MRIIAEKTLREFWENHADARDQLENWIVQVKSQKWKSPKDVKEFRSDASILRDNRVVFNIKGNDYRLIVRINYESNSGLTFVRFIGTHAEYDKIDAETI